MNFKDRLREIVNKVNVPKKTLAKECQVSESQFFAYLRGEQRPSHIFYENLKKHYPSVNLNWLISGFGEPFASTLEFKSFLDGSTIDVGEYLMDGYIGGNEERIVKMIDEDNFNFFKKTIMMYIICNFLSDATKDRVFANLLREWVSYVNPEYVDGSHEEAKSMILANIDRAGRLFKLALFGFEYNLPGLVFYFGQTISFLDFWEYDFENMEVTTQLLKGNPFYHNPFIDSISPIDDEIHHGFTDEEVELLRAAVRSNKPTVEKIANVIKLEDIKKPIVKGKTTDAA